MGGRATLLIVYEPRTETLVHHFNQETPVSDDWILYVLGRADQDIRARAVSRDIVADSVCITVPDLCEISSQRAVAYVNALERLKKAVPVQELPARWRGRYDAKVLLKGGAIDGANALTGYVETTFQTAQSFKNALIRASRAFNAVASIEDHGVCLALNPQKGEIVRKEGWEEEERLRRRAAASNQQKEAS